MGASKDQWKKTETDAEYCHEKILGFISDSSEGGFSAGEAFLHRVFRDNMDGYFGLPVDYIHLLLKCIEERQVFRNFVTKNQDKLIQDSIRLDSHSLPSWRWLALQYLCIRSGFFKTAYFVRQKAVEIAEIDAGKSLEPYLSIAFRAGIDQAEFEKARALLVQIKAKGSAQILEGLESYYNLNIGSLGEFQQRNERELNKTDRVFLSAIEGKSVAIVGPAPTGEEHGDEIDSFDIVIRINYNGWDKIPDSKEFGKRTDISYYNITFSKEISESGVSYFDDLYFAVFKRIEHDFQKQLITSGRGREIKYNYQLFNGTPLGGSHAVYDILHFRPARVKLFNINFYLSKNPYHNEYFDGKFLTYFDTFNFITFAHHDIISNLNFTRNLLKAGLIEVDDACRDVVSLNTYEYLSAMENLFVQEL